MNAPEKIEMPDLSYYGKDALAEIYTRLSGGPGDYARTKKVEYRNKVLDYGAAAVQQAISELMAEGIIAVVDEEEGAEAPAPSKPSAPVDTAALEEATKAFIAAVANGAKAPLDPEAVRKIAKEVAEDVVQRSIDGLPVKTEKIVVQGVEEIKVEGLTHEKFERVVKLIGVRQHIMLVGPAGSGKTQLAHQAADALKMRFASISCSAGMSESKIFGYLLPIGESGRFEYVPSSFVEMYENGGVFLFDEIDASDENVLVSINQALANGGFFLPQRSANPYVKRHPDFVCLSAANTFGHGADTVYAGRNKLDGATLDRFRAGMVRVDYDAKLEKQIVDVDILHWGRKLREQVDKLKLRRVVSTRVLADFTKQKRAGVLTMEEMETTFFMDWTRDEMAKIGK